MHLSFPRVALFISLVISCSGKPTPFRHLADRSSNVTSSLSSLERRAGVTEFLTECGSSLLAEITIGDLDKKRKPSPVYQNTEVYDLRLLPVKLLIDTGSCWTWIKKESLGDYDLGEDKGRFVSRISSQNGALLDF